MKKLVPLLVPFLLTYIGLSNSSCSRKVEKIKIEEPSKEIATLHFLAPEIPKSMTFAGKKIDFSGLDLKERLDRELVVNNFWHSRTILSLKRAHRWFPMIKKILDSENVPQDFVYLAVIESGLQNVRSYRGANGFWQLMEPTGKEYGLRINKQVDERLDVKKSTLAACLYVKNAHEKLHSWILAAAAYNMGVKALNNELDRQHVTNYFDLSLNTETSRYVFRILAIKLLFQSPKKYGFYLDSSDLYAPYQTQAIKIDSTVKNLVDWSINHKVTLKIFRKLNPWVLGDGLKVKKGQEFIFKIPKDKEQFHVIGG